ncbi:MAG: Asp-tRNA(Asn)/Glu-tRNA(Gln) amidotransferase subunit GatC [bacterium]|nr:Asp-tRNA(Asn)/Glu-tRNA(Gln) amidotransferase subunit GatC [bacterium]
MSKLSKEEIEAIAELARLELSDKEKELYAKQLSVVFDYVDILQEVDTADVVETCQVTGLEDVFRVDAVAECESETRKKLIEQFPDRVGDLLRVKQVFDNE